MDVRNLVERIHDHVEEGAVDKAVFACLRLARSIGDWLNHTIFLRELSVDEKLFHSTFIDATKGLKKEAQEFLFKTSLAYWLSGRKLDGFSFGDDDGEERNVLTAGVGELQRELEHFEKCISDIQDPTGMCDHDTAAFAERNRTARAQYRLRIQAGQTVLERLRTRCDVYASRIDEQMAAQMGNKDFLNEAQCVVNNFFAARSEDVYNKLLKAAELSQKWDAEDQALGLASVRRALSAVADHFYPPVDGQVTCQDGEIREMGPEQYLNRLHEFCMKLLSKSTADELARAELAYLSSFMRRLNKVASKGVHGEVSRSEARQGLIGLYMFLFNIVTRLETKQDSKPDESDGR